VGALGYEDLMMNLRLLAMCGLVGGLASLAGCTTMSAGLGQGPTMQDLENDGASEQQLALYRRYEVVYDSGTFRRPGPTGSSNQAAAWSDEAFNYLSSSDRAGELMESPAIAFDTFAHSGKGETVLLGTGLTGGLATGAIAWFIQTTVRDGVSEAEFSDLWTTAGTGLLLGGFLGVIVAGAYTYIVPNVSAPFAVPIYRQAARAFNEDLEEGIVEASPAGDAPPEAPEESADGVDGVDDGVAQGADGITDGGEPSAAAPAADGAAAPPTSSSPGPAPIEPREG
jgi:hypothetical protein